MSYDIELVDPVTKETLLLDEPHHMRGGTYPIGGERRARLNVTYNYAKHYYRVFPEGVGRPDDLKDHKGRAGVRSIYGMTGADSVPVLKGAIGKLGDEIDEDYWKPTEGNAKRALLQLLALAQMRPDGVWAGD